MFEVGDWVVVTPRYLLIEGIVDYSQLGNWDKKWYDARVGEPGIVTSSLSHGFYGVNLPYLKGEDSTVLFLPKELDYLRFPQLILEV